jgi:hypothetical protein
MNIGIALLALAVRFMAESRSVVGVYEARMRHDTADGTMCTMPYAGKRG